MNQHPARCHGVLPEGPLCPKRRSCLRFTATEGDLYLTPKVEDEHCWDYLPELGQRMIEGMMEEKHG
jgi:hypothetical protein